MITDTFNEFADNTALSTVGTGLALVGDVIDLQGTSVDAGNGEPLYLVLQIADTAVTSGGSATVQFELASDAQAAIAADGSATTHVVTADIAKATLVAGYRVIAVALPQGDYERYLGILQNVTTAALTAGSLNAFLARDVPRHVVYPDAI